jgi:hypothetical protein
VPGDVPQAKRVRILPRLDQKRVAKRMKSAFVSILILSRSRPIGGDLPVLVHVVSQRARVLRLRRTCDPLAIGVIAVLPSPLTGTESAP